MAPFDDSSNTLSYKTGKRLRLHTNCGTYVTMRLLTTARYRTVNTGLRNGVDSPCRRARLPVPETQERGGMMPSTENVASRDP